jgi:exodeoxyribonuclease VII small subunit
VSQDLTYEQSLEKLDEKLKLLEDGELSLEDALKAVDEARKIEVRAAPETTSE